MSFFDAFEQKARQQKRTLAIGLTHPDQEIIDSLKKASQYADLVIVGSEIPGFTSYPTKDDDEATKLIIQMLKEKQVDGIVRGQLKDSSTFKEFFKQFGKEEIPSKRKVSPCIMQSADGKHEFVMSEASIYHGMTYEDKLFLAERTIKYIEDDLGVKPKIAVMSARRPTSIVGEYPLIEEVDERCLKVADALEAKGYEVKRCYFEYEAALEWGANYIIPQMGMVGNAVFRALHYMSGWKILSCPYLDLGAVYEDGSRNQKDFFYQIVHAVAQVNTQK